MIPAWTAQTQHDLVEANAAVGEVMQTYQRDPDYYKKCTATPRCAFVRRAVTQETANELRRLGYGVDVTHGQTQIRW